MGLPIEYNSLDETISLASSMITSWLAARLTSA